MLQRLPQRDSRVGSLVAVVRRHLVLVLALTLVAFAAAAGYVHEVPTRFTATATLLPRPATGNPLGPDTSASNGAQLTVAMQTEAGLVDTPTVSALASSALGTTVPRPHDVITAMVPSNTQIIRIVYVSSTRLGAKEGAQAFADAFLRYRKDVATAALKETLSSLQSQAATSAAALQEATRAAARSSDPHSFAAQQVLLYSDRLASLDDSISATESLSTNPGVLVTAASLPGAPNGLNPIAVVVGGGLLGLVAGLLLAARLEWRTDVLDSSADYEIDGVPVLAKLPQAGFDQSTLVSDHAPESPVAEAYRRMRAGLIATAEPPKTIAVSCVRADESSGRIATNLGISLAQAGFRVTVVAADPFDRSAEALLAARLEPGLADIVMGHAESGACIQSLHGIDFVAGGADPQAARERYAGPRLRALMTSLAAQADYVIVACAESASSDADAVVMACHGVLMVVNDGVTTHSQTSSALDRFLRLGVATLGVVSLPVQRRDAPRHAPAAHGAKSVPEVVSSAPGHA